MRVAALLLCAGRGERLGHALPKCFVPLAGRPLLAHPLSALEACPEVDRVVPVVGEEALERFAALDLPPCAKRAAPVAGGARRQDSVAAGLAALPEDVGWVAVHDAARALIRPEAVGRVVNVARRSGAALLAVPVRDTIKRVREGEVVETPPRDECWAAQTPQVFRVELLREALAKAAAEGRSATDCAQLVEAMGVRVRVVEGDAENWKVTYPEDLARAAAALEARG